MQIRIGTRKSRLALVQAEMVAARLRAAWPGLECELVTMSTSGDRLVDRPLSEFGGKGLFTKELEEGLFADGIDFAVHSMKDMQTVLPDGLIVAAVLEREDPRDMLVGKNIRSLDDLPQGALLGTSSLRRAAQMLIHRPDLKIAPLRGNVETRLKKLEEGSFAATLLAKAGLNRLGLNDVPGVVLSAESCLPAVAQGAIALECRAGDAKTRELLAPLDHKETHAAVTCERAFLRVLDGSCRTPIAGYAAIMGDKVHFHGLLSEPDGSAHGRVEIQGNMQDAERLGVEAGERLRKNAG